MTIDQVSKNRNEVAVMLEIRKEEKKLEAINSRLQEEEAEYFAGIERQMDYGYLFESINRSKGHVVHNECIDIPAIAVEPEWNELHPILHRLLIAVFMIMALAFFSEMVAGVFGLL